MNERQITWAIAVSLVPAVALYWWFGPLNSADVGWGAVKLGGPVAAFFAVLMAVYKMFSRPTAASAHERKVVKAFVGRWRLTSKSDSKGRELTSMVSAEPTSDGWLRLSGNLVEKGTEIVGHWNTEEVYCTPSRLVYRYRLSDSKAKDQSSVGYCILGVDEVDARGPKRLSGTWEIIGRNYHNGTLVLERSADE